MRRLAGSGLHILRELDVSIAGLRPPGLDAEHDDLAVGGGPERGTDELKKARRFCDNVVRRKHAHHRIRVDRLQNMGGEPDGWGGIALGGFGQNLVLRHLGQLTHDLGTQMMVGENP